MTSPLTNPSFRWYLLSLSLTLLASELTTLAVSWRLFELTRDPLALGLIGLAAMVPFLSSVLYAGHLADVADRRWIAALALTGLIASTALLAGLDYCGQLAARPWTAYAAVAAASLARGFLVPARGALMADLVTTDQREAAARVRATVFQFTSVGAKAGGGFIYAAGVALGWGSGATFVLAAVLLVVAALAMLAVVSRPQVRPEAPAPVLRSLAEGMRFLGGNRILLGAMLLDLLAVLFGDAIALAPVFADQILHLGPDGLGLLRAAPAVGALAMSLLLARLPPFTCAGPLLLWSVAGFGLTMIGFALATHPVLAFTCLALSGALDFINVTVRSALVQVLTPPAMLGRVTAMQQIFIWSSNELGAFESGLAAHLLGVVPSVIFGGLMTLGVTGAIAWTIPELRRLGRISDLPAARN
ncbi:MFS transporter [Planctomycetota bacterium]|nr:MFS transporter [Planctomycetota bacterium]